MNNILRKFVLLALVAVPSLALAQGSYQVFNITTTQGTPVTGANVAVCTTKPNQVTPCGLSSLAQTYSDVSLANPCVLNAAVLGPLYGIGCTNPGLVDGFGIARLFAPSGVLYYQAYNGGILGIDIETILFPATSAAASINFYQAMLYGTGNPAGNVGGSGAYYLNLAASPVQVWQNNFGLWAYTGISINSTLTAHTSNYAMLTGDAQTLLISNGVGLTFTLPSSLVALDQAFWILNQNASPLTVNGNGHTISGNASVIIPGQSFLGIQLNAAGTQYVFTGMMTITADASGDRMQLFNNAVSFMAPDGSSLTIGDEATGAGAFFLSNPAQSASVSNLGNNNLVLTGKITNPGGVGTTQSTAPICPGATGGGFTTSGCAFNTIIVNGTQLSFGDSVNFNSTTPAAPANGTNVTFATSKSGSTDSISAALIGDGNSGHCYLGTGVFAACPSAGGVSGSGTSGIVPVFVTSTSIGNSPIAAGASSVTFGQSPSLTGPQGMFEANSYNGAGNACTDTVSFPYTTPPCSGFKISDSSAPTSNLGFMSGLSVVTANTLHNTSKLLGLYDYVSSNTSGVTTDEWGAYIVAEESIVTTVTNRHGAAIFSFNDTPNTTALNEGLLVETGGNGGTTNTTDYTIHVQTPFAGDTLTTHAGIEVEAQGTGVPFQLKPQAFSTLAACSATYEGSHASINDSTTATWGATITGGGTNHVSAYCDGTHWTVEGS